MELGLSGLSHRPMGRPLRAAAGGMIYHGWHRANGRPGILETAGDYEALERVVVDALTEWRCGPGRMV